MFICFVSLDFVKQVSISINDCHICQTTSYSRGPSRRLGAENIVMKNDMWSKGKTSLLQIYQGPELNQSYFSVAGPLITIAAIVIKKRKSQFKRGLDLVTNYEFYKSLRPWLML